MKKVMKLINKVAKLMTMIIIITVKKYRHAMRARVIFFFGDYTTLQSLILIYCGLYLSSESLRQNLKGFCTKNVTNRLLLFGKYL